MDETEDSLLRQYETQLDKYHESLPFWGQSRPEAIYAIMANYDWMFILPFLIQVDPVQSGTMAQEFHWLEEGIAQSLRWLTSTGCTSARSVADPELIKSAQQFCMHAFDYVRIADGHRALNRGWVTARVDAERLSVTFDVVEGPGLDDALAWHEQTRDEMNRGAELSRNMKPADIARAEHSLASMSYELLDGHIRFTEFPPDLVEETRGAIPFGKDFELLPLASTTDLLGFTMHEFWSFVEAVTVWSYAAFRQCRICVAQGVPLHQCMPTQIVYEEQFVDLVTAMSHLSGAKVQTILDRLTFRPGEKADILLTPFLRGEGCVCWSPMRIMRSSHQRNLLKIMSRGSKDMREHTATINGERSRMLGRLIGREFTPQGYYFKLDTRVAANGEETEIDVLLYKAARPGEILIIEAKALIAPDEINEVNTANETLRHAQDQVRSAMRILDDMSATEKRQKFRFVNWERVSQYYGAVVITDAEAHWQIDQREIPVITYNSLRWRFRRNNLRYPGRFWMTCVQRPWWDNEIRVEAYGHGEIKVGAITYRLPMSFGSTGPREEKEEAS